MAAPEDQMKIGSTTSQQHGVQPRPQLATWLTPVLLAALVCSPVFAQERDVAGAAQSFGEAQQAELRGDYQAASRLYGLADELAPAAEALRGAARTAQLAGLDATAATHAEALLSREHDAASRTLAEDILRSTAAKLTRLHITCDAPCNVLIDGRMTAARVGQEHVLYARPGERGVSATFEGNSTKPQLLTLTAGSALDLTFSAASLIPPSAVAAAETTPVSEQPESHKLSPWYLGSAAAATVVAGGLTIWSGLKVKSKHDDYDPASETAQADYDEGRKLEKQTNALIGVTSAFAVATVALAFFTDFKRKDSSSDKQPAADSLTMNATRQGAVLGWKGSF
jgi:hypothetical protein